jgi:hypothetical protein
MTSALHSVYGVSHNTAERFARYGFIVVRGLLGPGSVSFYVDLTKLANLIQFVGASEGSYALVFEWRDRDGDRVRARRAVWNAMFLLLWNTLCNLYPAALQRHSRVRLRISRGCPMRTTDPSRTFSHTSMVPLASTTIVEP